MFRWFNNCIVMSGNSAFWMFILLLVKWMDKPKTLWYKKLKSTNTRKTKTVANPIVILCIHCTHFIGLYMHKSCSFVGCYLDVVQFDYLCSHCKKVYNYLLCPIVKRCYQWLGGAWMRGNLWIAIHSLVVCGTHAFFCV